MEVILNGINAKEDWLANSRDAVFKTKFGESFNQQN